MPTPDDITGVVLAGGGGERLGGVEKGLVHVAGKPLAAWVLESLRSQLGHCLISANRHRSDYAALGAAVIADHYPGGLGPMAGIHAALAAAPTPWILCAPCDAPLLSGHLVARLSRAVEHADARIAVAQADGRTQAAHALIHRVCLPALAEALDVGAVAMHRWHGDQGAVAVPCDDMVESFSNINTPEELEAFAMRCAEDKRVR